MSYKMIFGVWKQFLLSLSFLLTVIVILSLTCASQDQIISLNKPQGLAVDNLGNLFIADTENHRILRLGSDGKIVVIAGNGAKAFEGDGEIAVNAALNTPKSLVVDEIGNIYVADSGNNRIRKIDATSKIITTIVGTGEVGFGGDGGMATRAQLKDPSSIILNKSGNLYIADTQNDRIRWLID